MIRSLGFLFRRVVTTVVTGCDDLLFSVFDWLAPTSDASVALVRRDDATRTWTIGPHPLDRAVWDRSVTISPDFGQTKPEGWGDGTALGGSGGNDTRLKARLPLARVGARVFAWTPGWDDLSYAFLTGNGVGGPNSLSWGTYLQEGCVNCRVSDDGGATWADFTALLAIRQVVADGQIAYCLHDDGLSLSRSIDGGLTWALRATQPTHTPPAYPGGTGVYQNPAPSARWWTLAIDPVNRHVLTLVDKEGFWTSYDGGATLLGPMRPGGVKLHYEGDTAFEVSLRDPAYSDYWADDYPCADVIRLADGSGYVGHWEPSTTRNNDNPTIAFHALVGTDDPSIPAGGTIAVTQWFHPAGHPFQVDTTSRLWRGQGDTLYLGTTDGLEASVYQSVDGGVTWTVAIPVPSLALTRSASGGRRPGGTGGATIATNGDVLLAPGAFGFGPGWNGDDVSDTNGPRLWRYAGGAWAIDDDDAFVPATVAYDDGVFHARLYATLNQGFIRLDCPPDLGRIYVSAGWGDGDESDYRIVRWDNPGWTLVSSHPISGAFREDNFGVAAQWSRWPIRFTGTRLWAWAVPEFEGQEDIPAVIVNGGFSDDGGVTWHPYWGGVYDIQPGVGDVAWASADNGQTIYKSTDNGGSWAAVWPTGPGGDVGGFPVNKWGRIAPHPTNPDIVAVKSFLGVRITTDGFATLGPVIGPGSTVATGPYPVYDAVGMLGDEVAARWDTGTLRHGALPLTAFAAATGADATGAENVGLLVRLGDKLYFCGEGYGNVGLLLSADGIAWERIFYSPSDNPYLATDGGASFAAVKALGALPDGTLLAALDANLYHSHSPDSGKSQFVSRAPGGPWVSAGVGFDRAIQGIDQSSDPGYIPFIVSRDGVATVRANVWPPAPE
jgi:hypothetical protein